jgi:M6 family metalloprotease-like protein
VYLNLDSLLGILFSLLVLGLLIPMEIYGQSFENDIILQGRYVTFEKFYEDGHIDFEHYLYTKENNLITSYRLSFNDIPQNILELSGSDVTIRGKSLVSQRSLMDTQQEILVSEFSMIEPIHSEVIARTTQPASMNSVVLLSKYSDKNAEPLPKSYFEDKYFGAAPSLSMSQYWKAASYEKFAWSGYVQDWESLPHDYDVYRATNPNIESLRSDSISIHDPDVDFASVNQVIFVYNKQWIDCVESCYAFASLTPVSVYTDEGEQELLVVYAYSDLDSKNWFPVGKDYKNGLGIIAHEIGHTFGWRHTMLLPPLGETSYHDMWSLMSGGNHSPNGPSGVIGDHKIDAGWINAGDVITVSNGQIQTITLDFLDSVSSPNYLVVKVPFGSQGHYYTVEARRNSTFEATPQGQTGIIIYHYSPTGHGDTVKEPDAPILLVVPDPRTENPSNDFDNADLDIGQSYTENGVKFQYLSNSSSSITIRINNNSPITSTIISNESSCESAPVFGTWTGGNTCTVSSLTFNYESSVTINPGITLINSGTLTNFGTITNNGSITTNGNITNNSGGAITNNGTITNNSGRTITNLGIITNNGTITNNSSGTIDNFNSLDNNSDGIINNSGTINNFYIVDNSGGTITNTAFGSIINHDIITNNGSITNIGTINNSDGTIDNYSLITNNGSITNNFSTINNSGIINNSNTITNTEFGTIINTTYGTITNLGTITNQGIVFNSYSIDNSGIIDNTGGTIQNSCGAIFSGNLPTGNQVITLVCITTISNQTTCQSAPILGTWTSPNKCTVSSLTINSGATVTINSDIILINSGTVTNNGTLTNSGTFVNNDIIDNQWVIINSGIIENSFIIYNDGILNNSYIINNLGTIHSNDFLTNSGTINNSGTLDNTATLINNITAEINNSGIIDNTYGDITNNGIIHSECGAGYSGTLPTGNSIVDLCTSCIPTASGNWTINSSCSLSTSAVVTGNVIVQNNSVLVIPNGKILDIDFEHKHLLIQSGCKVMIKSGGTIK